MDKLSHFFPLLHLLLPPLLHRFLLLLFRFTVFKVKLCQISSSSIIATNRWFFFFFLIKKSVNFFQTYFIEPKWSNQMISNFNHRWLWQKLMNLSRQKSKQQIKLLCWANLCLFQLVKNFISLSNNFIYLSLWKKVSLFLYTHIYMLVFK